MSVAFDLARLFAGLALLVGVLIGWPLWALAPLVAFVVTGLTVGLLHARR